LNSQNIKTLNKKQLKWIIVPIETKVREFHAKLLLCCAAAEKGYGAILGHQHLIKKKWFKLPRGICFDKSIVRGKEKKFNRYQKYGNYVVAWCEEGLLLIDKNDYQRRRIHPNTLAHTDLFFTWGKHQKEVILDKVPDAREKLINTGNPRIDLLRKEFRGIFNEDALALKEKYGDYILINTNFSPYNHIRGAEAGLAIQKKAGKIRTHEHEASYRKFIKFKKAMFNEFVSIVQTLAPNIPDKCIIVRPHPSENHHTWQDRLRGLKNVHIIHQGSVIPWIMGAQVSIHNGCTTGLEAYLLDRPVISYQPSAPRFYDFYLPDAVSEQAHDVEQLIHLTLQACNSKMSLNRTSRSKKKIIINEYIQSVNGCLASDNIIQSLEQLPVREQKFKTKSIRQFSRSLLSMALVIKSEVGKIKDRLVLQEKYFTKSQDKKNLFQMQTQIMKQTFSGIELEEINQVLEKFKAESGRFANVSAVQVEKNCFAIGAWD